MFLLISLNKWENIFHKKLNVWQVTLRELSVHNLYAKNYTAQKMKFSIKDFFSKCDQIRSFLPIWSHLLKKSLIENFFFCAVLRSG